jgi:hypothetical protein
MGATSVAFRTRLPERVSKGRQAFLPCDDGALSVVKLPLQRKELLLQLDDHYRRGRRGPTPINKQRPMS